MDKLRIAGGQPLKGRVRIAGAKNAALPALAACLLTGETVQLSNMPFVRDVRTMRRVLEQLGASRAVAIVAERPGTAPMNRPNAPDRMITINT